MLRKEKKKIEKKERSLNSGHTVSLDIEADKSDQNSPKVASKNNTQLSDIVFAKEQHLPVKQGWVYIHILNAWKKRWTILYNNGALFYYVGSKV